MGAHMIILGVDPGFAITGYGLIEHNCGRFKLIGYGVIRTSSTIELPQRLVILCNELNAVIDKYKPEVLAVEELFFSKNIKTAIKVAHGRGIAVMCGSMAGLDVFEYTPLQVKQAVVGYGRADKKQVQEMTKIMLKLDKIPEPDDAADALAIAICHANTNRRLIQF